MASGGSFSGSFSKGSEETFEFCCSLCAKDNNVSEAVRQCLDCVEYFCATCFDVHAKISTMAGHQVLDKKHTRKVEGAKPQRPAPTQMCETHHDERVTTYCAEHDEICCNTCVSVAHKTCSGVTYIIDAAQGFKSDQETKTIKANITTALKELKNMKDSRQNHLATLDSDKTANIKRVIDFTEEQIKRLRELKVATIEQINQKDEEVSGRARADVAALDDMIAVAQDDLQKLGQGQGSEPKVFVDAKLSQRHEADSRKLLQRTKDAHNPSLKFVPKVSIAESLYDHESLGDIVDDGRVYTTRPRGEYRIKIKQDKATCYALGSCLLSDGSTILADFNNDRLKRLDANYNVTDHCDLPGWPWGVVCTAPGEVAVTMKRTKKVQFVSVDGSMSMTRSFRTSDHCRGICCSGGELFVSCGGESGEGRGHVAVYTLHGNHLRTIQSYPSGQQIFSVPRHITASPDGDKLYIADVKHGVVALDKYGSKLLSFADPSLKYAHGVCTLDNSHVLVSGRDSNNILQFDGRNLSELLVNAGGVKKPVSLCHDGSRSRLVVTMGEKDTIKVFDLV